MLRYDKLNSFEVGKLAEWMSVQYPATFEERTKLDGSKRYICKIRNLHVSVDFKHVYINGSIPKFYIGNNVENISVSEIDKAISLLEASLGGIVNIKDTFVRRLDIGTNVPLKNKPDVYISKLHTASLNRPYFYNNQTIGIGNKSRGIVFYDKTSEVKSENRRLKSSTTVPENIIRIESYLKGRKVFEKHFGTQLPTLSLILDNIDKLPDIWLSEYKKINKEYCTNIDQIRSQKDLLYYTIVSTGYTKCEQVINYSFDIGLISKQDRYRYHNTVKAAYNMVQLVNPDDVMSELDLKVLDLYKLIKGK